MVTMRGGPCTGRHKISAKHKEREKGKQGCRCGRFTELVGVLGVGEGVDATVLYGMRHLKTVGAQLGAVDPLSLWWWLDRRITDTCDRMLTDNHTAVTGGGGVLMHLWDGRYTPLKTGWRPGMLLLTTWILQSRQEFATS